MTFLTSIGDFFRMIFSTNKTADTPAPTPRVIRKDGWAFAVEVDGDDLVVRDCVATCFGGVADKMDNGDTASGVSTRNPAVRGVALPVLPGSLCRSTADSPLPRIPWQTPVAVTIGGKTVTAPLLDNGPAKSTGNAIDLTIAVAREFNSTATANCFKKTGVTYRVIGGAKYLVP